MALITIARGTLSVATELAGRLASTLGYRVVSREDVYEAAKAYGIKETGLGDLGFLDQRPPSLWYPFYDKRRWYLACFQAALMDAALSGDLVYVGHLGQLLFSTYRRVLRVRLAAPDRYRVEALAHERGMTEAQALSYIRDMDERRLRWSQFLYGLDWRDPELYDLVLNPERLRVETMTEAVARIARSEELQPTSHDHEWLRNLRLVAVGRAALLRSARTRLLDVTLEADATSGRLRVYGVASSMSIETGERDLRSVLAQVPDITGIDVMLEEDPFR
jgi:cytidylate kinase